MGENPYRLAAEKQPGKATAAVRRHHNEIAIARLSFRNDPFRRKPILNVGSLAGHADALSLHCHARKNSFRIRRRGLLIFLGLESNSPFAIYGRISTAPLRARP